MRCGWFAAVVPALVWVVAACGGEGPRSMAPGQDVVAGDPAVDPMVGQDAPGAKDPGADEAAVGKDPGPEDLGPPPDFGSWIPDPGDAVEAVADASPEQGPPATCGFGYDFPPWEGEPTVDVARPAAAGVPAAPRRAGEIDHPEPDPPGTFLLPLSDRRAELVMPDYQDDLSLFPRAREWEVGETRCYETPLGAVELAETAAWTLYRDIAEKTTGSAFDATIGRRTVVGIRGAYPGTFAWNGNGPNRFNDTLALLWRDADGRPRVLEFAANTDTGAHVVDSMSSLWPNRKYRYRDGWHKSYNALRIDEIDYRVRDDANSNGHWDSDRNGWLPPFGEEDFDREGSAHNIHYAQAFEPLETAIVDHWSAGCQNIPGMANWTRFITSAWQHEGAEVDYFLVDARDIDPTVWGDCVPDGSHACPFRIESLPFETSADTTGADSEVDFYNCSTADEGGPEQVYVLNLHESGTLSAAVSDGDGVDVDVHLLMGDDARACIVRDDHAVEQWLPPGRYVIVADTFVSGGTPKAGAYTLSVDFRPENP